MAAVLATRTFRPRLVMRLFIWPVNSARPRAGSRLESRVSSWPERRFSLAGDLTIEPQNGNRVQVTFPLRYELRNGAKHLSGKVDKTLMLEPAGDDLQIVAVNERKAE